MKRISAFILLIFLLMLSIFISCRIPIEQADDFEGEDADTTKSNIVYGKTLDENGNLVPEIRIIATISNFDVIAANIADNPGRVIDLARTVSNKDGEYELVSTFTGQDIPDGEYNILAGMWVRNDNKIQAGMGLDFSYWNTDLGEVLTLPKVVVSNNRRIEKDLLLTETIHLLWQNSQDSTRVEWGDSTYSVTITELEDFTFAWEHQGIASSSCDTTLGDTTYTTSMDTAYINYGCTCNKTIYLLYCLNLTNGEIVWSHPETGGENPFLDMQEEKEYHFINSAEGTPFIANNKYRFIVIAGDATISAGGRIIIIDLLSGNPTIDYEIDDASVNFENVTTTELRNGDFKVEP